MTSVETGEGRFDTTETTGRNGVIIPRLDMLDEPDDTVVDNAFFWFRKLMKDNLGEGGFDPVRDALIVVPGSQDRQTVIVERSVVGERKRVDAREGGNWAHVGPREVYTVSMIGDSGVEPREVFVTSRQHVQQYGSIGGYPIAEPEGTVDVYGDEGWQHVTAGHLSSLKWTQAQIGLEDAALRALESEQELVRTSVEQFAAYLQ